MPQHSKDRSVLSSDRYLPSDNSEGRRGRSEKQEKRWQKKQEKREKREKRMEEEKTPEQRELESLYQKWEKVFDEIIECNIDLEPVAGKEFIEYYDDQTRSRLHDLRKERREIEIRIYQLEGTIPITKRFSFSD